MITTLKAVKPRVTTPAFESKKATTKPSKAVIILQDSDKLAIAPVISLANELFTAEEVHEKASIMLSKMRAKVADAFCTLMSDRDATYSQAQAYKKHLFESVATAQRVTLEHITKTLSLLIANSVKDGIYTNTAWTKSPKASAVSMTKARAENAAAMAKITTEKLTNQLKALAGMPEKVQAPILHELAKRDKVITKNHSAELKQNLKDLKANITKLIVTENQVACMAWAVNNIQVIEKLYKQSV